MKAERDNLFPTLDLIQKYGMLSDFDQDDLTIYATITRMGLTTKQMNTVGDIFFGVFPTGDIRGQATTTPRGDKIVLIHSGLLDLIDSTAKYLPVELKQNLSVVDMKDDNLILLNFLHTIGSVWKPELRDIFNDEEALRVAGLAKTLEASWKRIDCLKQAARVSVLGHEIAHVVGRHEYTNVRHKNYQIEFEADELSTFFSINFFLKNLREHIDNDMLLYAQLGPYLALAINALVNKDKQGQTHPSTTMRMRSISASLEKNYRKVLVRALNPQNRHMVSASVKLVTHLGERLVKRFLHYSDLIDDMEARSIHSDKPVSVASLYNQQGDSLFAELIDPRVELSPEKQRLLDQIRADWRKVYDETFRKGPL